jgi:hypothetical protein
LIVFQCVTKVPVKIKQFKLGLNGKEALLLRSQKQ